MNIATASLVNNLPCKPKEKDKMRQIKRLNRKSLDQLLLTKFLNEYGYEKGIVAARALIKDIVNTTDSYYAKDDTLRPGQIIWLATDKNERQAKGKTADNFKRKLIKLTLYSSEDVKPLEDRYSCFTQIKKLRTFRLIKEAYDQETVLTLEDISILLAVSVGTVSQWVLEYQKKNNEYLPTRGNIADIGPGITHKKQIINLYVKGMLTPEISRKTNHSRDAVDRYISDFERIKILKERNFSANEISHITGRGITVVQQYFEILQNSNK